MSKIRNFILRYRKTYLLLSVIFGIVLLIFVSQFGKGLIFCILNLEDTNTRLWSTLQFLFLTLSTFILLWYYRNHDRTQTIEQ